MKTKHIVLVLSALLFGAGLCSAQMIQRNYNGTGIIYANTPGVTEIGTAPTSANTWTGLQTFSGGITVTGAESLGAITVTSVNGNFFTTGTGTLTLGTGKTTTFDHTSTFTTTDAQTYTFPTTSATIARTDAANTFTGASTGTSWTLTTPVFSGTATGTYTLGGTPTIGAATATSFVFGSQAADHFVFNSATAAQTPAATTRTYITGSKIVIPATGLQVGAILHWCFDMTKTAAGSASSTIDIAFGTAGTTADTAQISFTKPAGTAAADEGVCTVECVIQSINASTGVALGTFTLTHNLASTGHAIIPCVAVATTSGSFNTVTPTAVGLCITTGTSDAITINQCTAWARGL